MASAKPLRRLYRRVLQISLGLGLLLGALGAISAIGSPLGFSIDIGGDVGRGLSFKGTTRYTVVFDGSRVYLERRQHLPNDSGYFDWVVHPGWTVGTILNYESYETGFDMGSTLDAALWLPLVILIPFPLYGLLTPALLQRRRRKLGLCLRCGYDLRNNTSGRCPECGVSTSETGETGNIGTR